MNERELIADGAVQTLPLRADHSPLWVDEGGAVRVGKSRISLDLVVEQYENGMTPEDMVRAYDTLVLCDVYAVIAYYLRHGDEVRAYLKRREEEAETLRAKIEAEHPRITREELPVHGMMQKSDGGSDGVANEFTQLVKEWKQTRRTTSTAKRMADHPAYRRIIDMGMPVVPLIIEQMTKEPDHWFIALHAITRASPVPVNSRGNFDEMTRAWIDWWREIGDRVLT